MPRTPSRTSSRALPIVPSYPIILVRTLAESLNFEARRIYAQQAAAEALAREAAPRASTPKSRLGSLKSAPGDTSPMTTPRWRSLVALLSMALLISAFSGAASSASSASERAVAAVSARGR